jgi:predicted dehydrogenase
MLKIAIIGYGYWGPNLLRNFDSIPQVEVSLVVDSNSQRLDAAKIQFPGVNTSTNAQDAFHSKEIEAVVIATPVFTHYLLALQALQSGKHVLVEKPLTDNSEEGSALIELAEKNKLTLMVDHTFLYSGAVQKMKALYDEGALGRLNYFDSTRINLGLIQQDVNVLWDLAPHDISVLGFLNDEVPVSVNATGVSHIHNGIENVAYLTVNYQSNFIAHFNCSWSSPVKIRFMLLGGSEKMIVFNDMEPSEKIKVYDTAHSVSTFEEKRQVLVDYRVGDVFVPKLSTAEPLRCMAEDFVQSIRASQSPISNAHGGLRAVQILEAAQESIKKKGAEVFIKKA